MTANAQSGRQGPRQAWAEAGIVAGAAVVAEVGPGIVAGLAVVAGTGVVVGGGPVAAGTAAGQVGVALDIVVGPVAAAPGIAVGQAEAALAVGQQAPCMPGMCGSTTVNIAEHSSTGSHKLDICSFSHLRKLPAPKMLVLVAWLEVYVCRPCT